MNFFKKIKVYIADIMDYTICKIFFALFLSMLIARFSVSVSKTIDSLMISNYLGEESLAAHSLVSPYFGIVATFSGLIAAGTQFSISKLIGKGKFNEADNIFTLATLVCFGVSAAATSLCYIFADQIMFFFGVSPREIQLYENSKAYFLGLLTGTIPLACNSILLPVVNINGDKSRTKYVFLLSIVINFSINYLSLFVFGWGMFGIGMGTGIAQWCCLFVYLLHFANKGIMCKFLLKGIDIKKINSLFVLGMPKATARICNTAFTLYINRWILFLASSTALAAVEIYKNIGELFFIPIVTISISVTLMSGIFFGEQDSASLKSFVRISLSFSLAFSLALAAVLFIAAPLFASIYVARGSQAFQMSIACMRWCALGLPFYALNEYYIALMLGTGKQKQTHLYIFFGKLVYGILAVSILGLLFGVKGAFASLFVSELCFFIHIFISLCLKNHTVPSTMSHFLLLPEGFEVDEDMVKEFTVNNFEDVSSLAQQISDFCEGRNVDKRRSYFIALCAEELAGNIVKHGFADGKKHSIGIRILCAGDDLILRLRDDCRLFDIREKYASINRGDVSSNIGIRLVMNIAKDVTYVNTMKVNTTTIRL